jgi:hypothetical protein
VRVSLLDVPVDELELCPRYIRFSPRQNQVGSTQLTDNLLLKKVTVWSYYPTMTIQAF